MALREPMWGTGSTPPGTIITASGAFGVVGKHDEPLIQSRIGPSMAEQETRRDERRCQPPLKAR
ncbi:hypothetical protein [Chitinolyticbacter albus]|uniref:hypothetical protein n=1 Tax=Chitinolyticbacter albus TaxID=2961951 RepID=UPI00210DC9C2|nr:hypothetical protein [Chitinolyticbacter albus]